LVDNLIQLVNILGSLFYGTILGVFLVAFFLKKVSAKSVFIAAILAELSVLACHILNVSGILEIGYLWYNVIGCGLVMLLAMMIELMQKDNSAAI